MSDADAARYANVDLATFEKWLSGPFGAEVAKIRAETVVLAGATLQNFLTASRIPAETKIVAVQRLLDISEARNEEDRLRAMVEGC